jgi:hypothetical protein
LKKARKQLNVDTRDKEEVEQLYGRMRECWDIELAIETWHSKTLYGVLVYVRSRRSSIDGEFRRAEPYPPGDPLLKWENSMAERERAAAGAHGFRSAF